MPPEHAAQPAAKKSLGQHFLHDANICNKIVKLLGLEPQDRVLEIGPGQGALTRILHKQQLASLCALEKDSYWATMLPRQLPGLAVAHADALRMNWGRLQAGRPWKLVGNLPYNVASPLVWDIAAAGGYSRCVFMVQKEVAQRLAAVPHSKQYGALSVWVQSHALVKLNFTVGPQVFRPRPKVDSAVFSLQPRPEGTAPSWALSHVLHICFQKRRKQLRTILRTEYADVDNILESIEIDGRQRPEDLSVAAFDQLARRLESCIPA